MQKPSVVAQLFPRLRDGRFIRDYFPGKPVVAHGPASRMGPLLEDPRLRDPRAMISAAATETVVAYVHTAAGSRHQVRVDKAAAVELYEHGATIDASAVNATLPAVGEFTQQLRRELGLEHIEALGVRASQIMCDAIISGTGDAVPKHFDGVETLSIQLTGRKVWKIATPQVRFPIHPYFPGIPQNRRDGQFYPDYFPPSFAKAMPRGSKTVIAKPGSVVFLPRGYWHQTRALEPCISLSFVLKTASWGDILGSVVDRALEGHAEWRAPVPYATEEQRAEARRRFSRQLERLAQHVNEYDVDSTLPDANARYAVADDARVVFEHRPLRRRVTWTVRVASTRVGQCEIDADDELAAVVRWIATRSSPFSAHELPGAITPSDWDRIAKTLVEAGLIVRTQA